MTNEKHDCFFDRMVFDDVTNMIEHICAHQIHQFLPAEPAFCKTCPAYISHEDMYDRLKAERGDDCLGE